MLLYMLKANLILAVFYGFYRLLFARDTFFTLRRVTLLVGYTLAFMLPLVDIGAWVSGRPQLSQWSDSYAELTLPLVVVTGAGGGMSGAEVFAAAYWAVAGVLLMRMAWQAAVLVRMARRMPTAVISGTRVHLLPQGTSPFSFFGLIFVCPEGQTDAQLAEILLHEHAHARQWHSFDVVLSGVVAALCWLNPFAWLIRREVRLNLEYLADERVLRAGNDRRAYQYHLLALTYTKDVATINNHFNVLPLKLRIRMMKKKRTRGLLRAKYLLMVPVAAMMLVACNMGGKSDKSAQTGQDTTAATAIPDSLTATVPSQADGQKAPGGKVFDVVDEMPQFPGGTEALMTYLNDNVKYPAEAVAKKKQGRVVVAFVVDKTGHVCEPKVVRGVDPQLDQEALRVVSKMPDWTPGKQKGEAVNVRFNVPISFRLK